MLKCSGKVRSGQWAVGSPKRSAIGGGFFSRKTLFVLLLTAHCTLLTASCRRDMQDQPKAKPYRSSSFFKDSLSSRPLVEGTVPRGWLRPDTEFFTGKKSKAQGASSASGAKAVTTNGAITAQAGAAAYPDDTDKFPFPVTQH